MKVNLDVDVLLNQKMQNLKVDMDANAVSSASISKECTCLSWIYLVAVVVVFFYG